MNATSSLWQRIVETTQSALQCGALQPIATQSAVVPDEHIQFYVRIIDSLARKEAANQARKPEKATRQANPFLPYESALLVEQLSDSHVCLLNKFNVVEHHILMVTREYEPQDTWLTHTDFEAFAYCLAEIDGLGFYNGGTQAGASQHHKHLQLVPLTSENGTDDLPIAPLIQAQANSSRDGDRLPQLPFEHCVALLKTSWQSDAIADTATYLLQTYQQLMAAIGLDLTAISPTIPYNLLLTRRWMLAVPRSQESYRKIGVNSLGYAGWLLVKTREDLERLKQIGPLALLEKVGRPSAAR